MKKHKDHQKDMLDNFKHEITILNAEFESWIEKYDSI